MDSLTDVSSFSRHGKAVSCSALGLSVCSAASDQTYTVHRPLSCQLYVKKNNSFFKNTSLTSLSDLFCEGRLTCSLVVQIQ